MCSPTLTCLSTAYPPTEPRQPPAGHKQDTAAHLGAAKALIRKQVLPVLPGVARAAILSCEGIDTLLLLLLLVLLLCHGTGPAYMSVYIHAPMRGYVGTCLCTYACTRAYTHG